jgi:hypothetical protein
MMLRFCSSIFFLSNVAEVFKKVLFDRSSSFSEANPLSNPALVIPIPVRPASFKKFSAIIGHFLKFIELIRVDKKHFTPGGKFSSGT